MKQNVFSTVIFFVQFKCSLSASKTLSGGFYDHNTLCANARTVHGSAGPLLVPPNGPKGYVYA